MALLFLFYLYGSKKILSLIYKNLKKRRKGRNGRMEIEQGKI